MSNTEHRVVTITITQIGLGIGGQVAGTVLYSHPGEVNVANTLGNVCSDAMNEWLAKNNTPESKEADRG